MIPVLGYMFIYSVIHSLLASSKIKHILRNYVGEHAYAGLYRIGYNLFAAATITPLWLLIQSQDSKTIWNIDSIWYTPLLILRSIGVLGFAITLLQADLAQLSGLKQLKAYCRNKPLPDEPLRTGGFYSFTRHPLYLFALLMMWPVPAMNETQLGFCISATIYFIIGSHFEELRMISTYGEAYTNYQVRVPRLFPHPRYKNRKTTNC